MVSGRTEEKALFENRLPTGIGYLNIGCLPARPLFLSPQPLGRVPVCRRVKPGRGLTRNVFRIAFGYKSSE